MARRLRYQVAVSLDGFIAGPDGEYDWIVMDPSIDFGALFKQFDTLVMGRKTYEPLIAQGGHGAMPGVEVVVFSRTLPPATHPGVRIVNDDPREVVAALKKKPGRDIWLFGGGELFRTLLERGLVDSVEVAVMPVLLGEGIPLLPPGGTDDAEAGRSQDPAEERHRGAGVRGARWRRRAADRFHQARESRARRSALPRRAGKKKAAKKNAGEETRPRQPATRGLPDKVSLPAPGRVGQQMSFDRPVPAVAAVTLAAQPPSRAVIAAATDIIQKAHYCTFITIDEDGQPQARMVDPIAPDADFTIWFATNPLTRKVDQVRRNPKVTLSCFDAGTSSYVTVLGRGELVTDVAEKQRHWKSRLGRDLSERREGQTMSC